MRLKRPDLLKWQWTNYPLAHRARRNLVIHALTMPLFFVGSVLVIAAIRVPILVIPGVVFTAGTVAAQGRGHRGETNAPIPFEGPLDVVTRLFVEQWVTFPRFVISGGFLRAWRASATDVPPV